MLKMPFLTDDDLLVVEFSNLFALARSKEIIEFHSMKGKVIKWYKGGLISVAQSVCRIVLTAPIYTFFYCLYVAYTAPNQVKIFMIFIVLIP